MREKTKLNLQFSTKEWIEFYYLREGNTVNKYLILPINLKINDIRELGFVTAGQAAAAATLRFHRVVKQRRRGETEEIAGARRREPKRKRTHNVRLKRRSCYLEFYQGFRVPQSQTLIHSFFLISFSRFFNLFFWSNFRR